MALIYHLLTPEDWQKAQVMGAYTPASLVAEGFIHASYASQIVVVAKSFSSGHVMLMLLCIDSEKVTSPVRDEAVRPSDAKEDRFPHIYGPLNIDAIVHVFHLLPSADGSFELPAGLG